MKKLLIATDCFLPRWDGIASFLNEMIPRLKKLDITVLAPNFGKLKHKYNARIVKFSTLKFRVADNFYPTLGNPFKISKEIKSTNVVWVQSLGAIGAWSIILGKIHKKPVLFYNHTFEWEVFPNSQSRRFLKVPMNIFLKFIGKILYNMCTIIIVPSLEQAELLNLMGIKSTKRIVHLGVDVDEYKPPFSRGSAKKKLGIDPLSFVIGYAGRVSLEKDLKTLYRAFIRLSKKYKNIRLIIAGGGRKELEDLFSSKENVILTGRKNNLVPYYQAMDVYVLPSLSETTSLTTMEAMACEAAVIATPVGFVKEYVDHGENGFLFPKKNSYELFNKIEYLKNNPVDRIALAKKGRETIVKNYSWNKTVDGIIAVIDSV